MAALGLHAGVPNRVARTGKERHQVIDGDVGADRGGALAQRSSTPTASRRSAPISGAALRMSRPVPITAACVAGSLRPHRATEMAMLGDGVTGGRLRQHGRHRALALTAVAYLRGPSSASNAETVRLSIRGRERLAAPPPTHDQERSCRSIRNISQSFQLRKGCGTGSPQPSPRCEYATTVSSSSGNRSRCRGRRCKPSRSPGSSWNSPTPAP